MPQRLATAPAPRVTKGLDSKFKSRLHRVLDEHQARIDQEQERLDQEHLTEVLFSQQFIAVKSNVILPALLELEAELKSHGHRCKIIEFEDETSVDGSGEILSIGCEFYPDGWVCKEGRPLSGPPSVTFHCDSSSRMVKVHECTSGPVESGWSGEVGAYAPDEITGNMVADAVVTMVEKILLDKSYITTITRTLTPTWTRPGRRVA